ncbi:MAG TPA: hypothetical protein VFP44_12870 [Usitatibacter sp.]|nr:hypothetical protein [Usitatibacter sp.]
MSMLERSFAYGAGAMLAACASAPAPTHDTAGAVSGGLQELRVIAYGYESTEDMPPLMRQGAASTRYQPLEGAACTLRNDRGAWTVVTPATANVELSSAKLVVECSREGFFTSRVAAPCLSERQRRTLSGANTAASLVASAGQAIAAAAPPVGLAVVGIAGAVAMGGAIGAATAGPGMDTCNYSPAGQVHVFMYPRPAAMKANW